jgi:alpha-tubulin suppressor-like RCC1 family protein
VLFISMLVSCSLFFPDDSPTHNDHDPDDSGLDDPGEQQLSYTITYDRNFNEGDGLGTAPVDTVEYRIDDQVTISEKPDELRRFGYRFSCWNTAYNGRGTDVQPQQVLQLTADTVLYAKWDPIVITKVVTNFSTSSASGFFSLYLTEEKQLWSMGTNQKGQLGINQSGTSLSYLPVHVTDGVDDIAAGAQSAYYIVSNNLYAAGYNSHGQFGLDEDLGTIHHEPVLIAQNVEIAAAGAQHVIVLKTNGLLYGAGDNSKHQLGLSELRNYTEFTHIPLDFSDIKQISCGLNHTLVLRDNGSVLAFGANEYGQLGINSEEDSCGIAYADEEETDYKYIIAYWSPRSISRTTSTNLNVTAVSAGGYHSLFLGADGNLFTAGSNSYGQLGLGTDTPAEAIYPYQVNYNGAYGDISRIAAGSNHSGFVTDSGYLLLFGSNLFRALGTTTASSYNTPTFNQVMNIADLSLGANTTFTIHTNGILKAAGWNYSGEFGIGNDSQQNSFRIVRTDTQ